MQSTVLNWLSNPDLPLGGAQRAAWHNVPPISDQEAYVGASYSPSGQLSKGAGLNPNAIVAISFGNNLNTLNPVTWDTVNTGVGVKAPVLTGMIEVSNIGTEDFSIKTIDGSNGTWTIDDLGYLNAQDLNIDSSGLALAGPHDWVAYNVTLGRIGRRWSDSLTGPTGYGANSSSHQLIYTMGDLPDGSSPSQEIDTPDFALPAPVNAGSIGSGVTSVSYGGAVSSTGSTGTETVNSSFYSYNSFSSDTLLFTSYVTVAIPADAWAGVLLAYSGVVHFYRDSYGNISGTGTPGPLVYQLVIDPTGHSTSSSKLAL